MIWKNLRDTNLSTTARYEAAHALQFLSYKSKNEKKLIHGYRSQNNVYFRGDSIWDGPEAVFWKAGNFLFLNLDGSYTDVFTFQ